MTKREHGIYTIICAAMALFRENGYRDTSVRQIAEKADVALGMVNHHFGSKETLGAQVLSLLDTYAVGGLKRRLSFHDDPILYDLVSVRVLYDFMSTRGYWNFYLDSLRYDFFFKHLFSHPPVLIRELQRFYPFEATEDDILLYSKYMPYMMEKTVVLKKEEGFFATISYDEVPYLICHTAMSHFIPEADILARDGESRRLADEIGGTLNAFPPNAMIADFARNFSESDPDHAVRLRDFWLEQLSGSLR